jgi:biotin synthase
MERLDIEPNMRELIDKLEKNRDLSDVELVSLIGAEDIETDRYLAERAEVVRREIYGTDVYIRGLIEFTSYCRNDCLYCGLRRSNGKAERYRLSQEEILACCSQGYRLGFRTFVLQGGEDPWYTSERMADIISQIKAGYPDCAITLSIGERSREEYDAYFNAGADRYLLRHEAADNNLYAYLHPEDMSLQNRLRCLEELKNIGFQIGCGFMTGAPGQTTETIVRDLRYIQKLKPHMVGIGPFIPHRDTPFGNEKSGEAALTLRLLAIIRLMLPNVLLPATTALGTVRGDGRILGIKYGANVIMPNLSPISVRTKYSIYENKARADGKPDESVAALRRDLEAIGYRIVTDRGDPKGGAL